MDLTDHERRVLAYLDQRGPTHRRTVVHDLAAPDSKIGLARDTGSAIGGGNSNNGEPMIMARWCKRLVKEALVRQVTDARGYYRHHEITPKGRAEARKAA